MRVLLTGADGYIGAITGSLLLERGHEVVGLDAGYYRSGLLYDAEGDEPACVTKDVREIVAGDVEGFDAVVHLADLSNDPLSELNPQLTHAINHEAGVELACHAREQGIERFVYSSSCSVYGLGFEDVKTEESEPNPQTAYAECKLLVEGDVSRLANDRFSPTFLRNATAYGPSPRMRFDLVLNNLSGHAWTEGIIRMTSDGSPWRPLVHVSDIAHAIVCVLEAPREDVHDQIFNVGDTAENYRVREIAEIVARSFPGCEISIGSSDGDNRSYRVSFDKLPDTVPEFRCQHDVRRGAEELARLFRQVDLTSADFEAPPFTRLKQIQHLLAQGLLDEQLHWRS